MNRYLIVICFLLLALIGCADFKQEDIQEIDEAEEILNTPLSEVENLIEESVNYLEDRDFDGDKINDYLSFDYTGGAHCCYKMSIKLSSQNDTISYPFEMDGGYGFGIVDGSQHDQFNIADYDQDGLPEIFMGISTYNGENYPIDQEWTDEYGITTNYIIFDYQQGEIILVDYNIF